MGSSFHEFAAPAGAPDLAAYLRAGTARRSIGRAIDALIEVLDLIDGDPDIEDDDPAGGNCEDLGEPDLSRGLPRPRWAIDQTLGPVNEDETRGWWFDEEAGVNRQPEWEMKR